MRVRLHFTMAAETALRLRRYARCKHKPLSRIVETAIEEFLRSSDSDGPTICTTPGRFIGKFSRTDAYGQR